MPEWLMRVIKVLAWGLLGAFAVYYVFVNPEQAAAIIKSVIHVLLTVFHALAH